MASLTAIPLKKIGFSAYLLLLSGTVLLSRFVTKSVPLPLRDLTSVFEMGTGVTLLLSAPSILEVRCKKLDVRVSGWNLRFLLFIYSILISFSNLVD